MTGITSEDIKMLSAEFDKADVHWRAQSVRNDGAAAMALAYIDARDVMDRLDSVCGVENWQCRYSHAEQKVVCDIGIRIEGDWIWKADGAGDTQVEAEKGSLSDAFKRAAVRWGIGRYLYALDAPWVPCDAYQSEYNGKKKWTWKGWKADPWEFVKGAKQPTKANARDSYECLISSMREFGTVDALGKWVQSASTKALYASLPADWKTSFNNEVQQQKAALEAARVATA